MDSLRFLILARKSLDDAISAMVEVRELREELEEMKKKYSDLLSESIKASEASAWNMVKLAMGEYDKGGIPR